MNNIPPYAYLPYFLPTL